MSPKDSRHTVAVVVFDRVAVFEMAVPCEVFGVDRSDMGLPNYNFIVCSAEGTSVRTKSGFSITTPHGLEALKRADTVVVPAWRDVNERPPQPLLDALRAAHKRGARIASLCSGSFVLAHAGLLDGKTATTHWMYAHQMAETFPNVNVNAGVLYVDQGSVLTSAGTAAGIDLCLHMVRKDHGAEVANLFAKRMVVPPHREGGQAQFIEAPVSATENHHGLKSTMDWALRRLGEDLTVERLAGHAHMSERTFARHFVACIGTTPLKWLQAQRVASAQRMLEKTHLTIDEVAERSGLGSAANLRLLLRRHAQTSPSAYRRTFKRTA